LQRFVADSILGGFDLNQQYEDNCGVDATVNEKWNLLIVTYIAGKPINASYQSKMVATYHWIIC
jgi:hypothetical protein